MEKPVSLPPHTILLPLEEFSEHQIHQLVYTLRKHHIDMMSAEEISGAHRKVSRVLLDEAAEMVGCVILTEASPEHIVLSQFFTAYKTAAPSVAILQAAAKALMEQFPAETLLEIPTVTSSTGKLVQRLIPDSKAVGLTNAVLDLARVYE